VSQGFNSVTIQGTVEDLDTAISMFLCSKLARLQSSLLLVYAYVMRDGSQF